jgi:glycosyltransferase involved in cell wall biosynthesis
LIAHCAQRIAKYKVPEHILPIEAFPVTPSANGNKIQKAVAVTCAKVGVQSALVPKLDELALLPPNVTVLGPQSHGALTRLLAETQLLVTDSGGLQEEAACLGVPTVVARDVTDRPEPIAEGLAILAGTRPAPFGDIVRRWLDVPQARRPIAAFGDGHAADRIADLLCSGPSALASTRAAPPPGGSTVTQRLRP